MTDDAQTFTSTLQKTVKNFDKNGAAALCDKLIRHLYATSEPYPAREAERVLQILRTKRMFRLMQEVGDALIQSGHVTPKIRRQYAQSQIDLGNLTAALAVLTELRAATEPTMHGDAEAAREHIEARGLIGRVYKQMYINAESPSNPRSQQVLQHAVQAYFDVYETDRQTYLWHGINVVALLRRAGQDGIALSGFPDPATLAEAILKVIAGKDIDGEATMWDFATAAEACIALNRSEEALTWIECYLRAPQADAFEIASTLRQFTDVWRLDMASELGKRILPILRAELLRREGGQLQLSVHELVEQQQEESATTAVYEKVFGPDSFLTYQWYLTGAERCRAVARIGRDSNTGIGTGFLLTGAALHPRLGDSPVLITNAHVLSDDPAINGALRSYEAVIGFEALGGHTFRVGRILWSSPPAELDATIIEFDPGELDLLKQIATSLKPYPIAKVLPLIEDTQRVYVIGHPRGGILQLSLQDNALLDHADPLLHYRTPTEGGSSGSPVFNRQWELLGLHHKGSNTMPMLNGKVGVYAANEGIWIKAVIRALADALAPAEPG